MGPAGFLHSSASGLAEMLESGARVCDGGLTFSIDEPRLAARHQTLMSEQDGGALAEPRLELGIESEGIEDRAWLRRVVFGAVEHGPPTSSRRCDNLHQPLARVTMRDHLNSVESAGLETIE